MIFAATISTRSGCLTVSFSPLSCNSNCRTLHKTPTWRGAKTGKFTEEEAQQVVDQETNDFLCIYCYNNYKHDQSMPRTDYTLTLLDNTKELKIAKNNLRRFEVQMKGKMIGDQQLRPGIFELLRKTRGKGKEPITSNLPSENYALGRGSKRIVGTGRTAAIKARKLEQQGVAQSAQDAQKILVGGKHSAEGDLMFLKNAMGNNIGLRVEKGSGFRAKHLVTTKRQRQKLMDAAAARVGTSVPLDHLIKEMAKRRQEEEERKKNGSSEGSKPEATSNGARQLPGMSNMDWLSNNISRQDLDIEMERLRQKDMDQYSDDDDDDGNGDGGIDVIILEGPEDDDALYLKDEETRKATFQHLYFREIGRQQEILQLKPEATTGSLTSPSARRLSGVSTDGESIAWEDA
jgi:hypothetical protein